MSEKEWHVTIVIFVFLFVVYCFYMGMKRSRATLEMYNACIVVHSPHECLELYER